METAFARWLRENGESHSAYATRKNLGKNQVAQLAGVARQAREKLDRFTYSALTEIKNDSGIPIETLIEDAVKAARNPVAPRRYVKKREGERADA